MVRWKDIGILVGASIIIGFAVVFAKADSANVVTMASDLTQEQKDLMFRYFDVDKNSVQVIDVTNQDERKYLKGVAPEAQIGSKTFSCAFIEPTKKGSGINVRTANLSYVSAGMISSTLVTAGVQDVNVLAAAPFNVSGTGALTGCFLAFEKSTGETLDQDKKKLATEEIVVTGDLGSQYSPEVATGMVNDIKADVIKSGTKDTTQIAEIINNVSNNYNIMLTKDNEKDLGQLMLKIAKEDYDYGDVKESLNHVSEGVSQRLDELGIEAKTRASGFWYKFKAFFSNLFSDNTNFGILENTNDSVLGTETIIDSTEDALRPAIDKIESSSFFQKIADWFQSLFDSEDEDVKTVYEYEDTGDPIDKGQVVEDNIDESQDPSPYPKEAPSDVPKSEMEPYEF